LNVLLLLLLLRRRRDSLRIPTLIYRCRTQTRAATTATTEFVPPTNIS
jgi:hypothetical protein